MRLCVRCASSRAPKKKRKMGNQSSSAYKAGTDGETEEVAQAPKRHSLAADEGEVIKVLEELKATAKDGSIVISEDHFDSLMAKYIATVQDHVAHPPVVEEKNHAASTIASLAAEHPEVFDSPAMQCRFFCCCIPHPMVMHAFQLICSSTMPLLRSEESLRGSGGSTQFL